MEASVSSRKRKLSGEAAFLPQLKCYVNENVQNQQSEEKMQKIYSRTVDLLFEGAKQKDAKPYIDKNARFREIKTLESNFLRDGKMPAWFLDSPVLVCNCMSNSRVLVECSDCNMNICERCGFACSSCRDPLCHSCNYQTNNSGSAEQPLCHYCASY